MNREIWVDPGTYLPLRMTASRAPGESYVMDYTWIPFAEAGAGLMWPEPPRGWLEDRRPSLDADRAARAAAETEAAIAASRAAVGGYWGLL